jgi:uncharacterized protein
VKTGQIVKVKVLGVDEKARRIALSIKALMAPPARPAAKSGKAAQAPALTMNDKLAALSMKWKGR